MQVKNSIASCCEFRNALSPTSVMALLLKSLQRHKFISPSHGRSKQALQLSKVRKIVGPNNRERVAGEIAGDE